MKFKIKGTVVITLESTGGKTSKLKATEFNLDVSGIPQRQMIGPDGVPTKEGAKALTQAFLHGIVGNIHNEHQRGNWDSAAHLRYVISEMERAFAVSPKIDISNFTM